MADVPAGSGDAKTVQWSPDAIAPQQQSAQAPQRIPANKMPQASTGACDACRARKVRCLANESSMSSKCQRCARAGRDCVYTVHSKTRRRKRTDTRVKELEEKVKSLSMLLEKGKDEGKQTSRRHKSNSPDVDENDIDDDDEWSEEQEGEGHYPDADDDPTNGKGDNFDGYEAFITSKLGPPVTDQRRRASKQSTFNGTKTKHVPTGSVSPDVIERGLISMEKAEELFNRYVEVLSPNYPGIFMAPGTSATMMRKERPILFLSAIAAGAGNQDPALNLVLNQEILQVYALKVAVQGEKSLELVMSILISTLWYYPPDKFEELKFHQYIHMAATMALDIGLGKRPRAPRSHEQGFTEPIIELGTVKKDSELGPFGPKLFLDSASMESRRTLLACYLSCSSVSMSLRLPNMLRFTSWMNECLIALETSSDAAPTDKRFAAWIRIQRLVENCVIAFSLDDPGSTVSLGDDRIQHMLKVYENQLNDMRKAMTAIPGLPNEFLEVNFHVNNVYIHEIALHPEHDSEDFRPPFFVTAASPKTKTALGPAYVNAITECVTSAQSVIKIFLGMHVETIRSLPALLYVRIIYCSVVLIKLDVSANSPESEMGKILDRDALLTRTYVEKALIQMKRVAGTENKNILAAKFCMILSKLVLWYRQVQPGAIVGRQPAALHPASAFDVTFKPENIVTDPQHTGSAFIRNSMADAMTAPPVPNPSSTFASFSSFSGAPQYPTPNQSPFHAQGTLSASSAAELQSMTSQAPLNHGTPNSAMDYSSPELMDPSGTTFDMSMDLDPSMFNQLQEANPFTFNQDPNEWIFDGIDYSNMADISGFDWNSIPGPQ